MRTILKLCNAGLAACMLLAAAAQAQAPAWPARAVRIVVPSSPGGGTDILARLMAQKLSESLGQSFVVDNRPGAGQVLGSDIVAHAAPDGYTLLMAASAIVLGQVTSKKSPYDVARDFAPITLVADLSNVLVVHPSVPANSVAELIAYAKAHPGMNYSSAGSGTSPHLSMELFRSMAGITLTHVPYKGTGPATMDLVAGQVQLSMPNILTALPHVKSGKLRALGVTGKRRTSSMPTVPPIGEAGLPGYEALQWYGLLAPAGTPPAIIASVQAQVAKSLVLPEVRERLATDGADAVGSKPEEFAAYIKTELDKWGKLVKTANITAD
ncbi:MAG TPA: tripartite tricarboxylate transporter substrate binding protein, partial [Burkholderiales bacterium]|jgi:tripartite-type tricarboxylate transporter receptor subunit TctC|nr:tripartite tricarboxylate transporter substrate binding protein [Burkholderiales bacterium]